MLVSRIVSELRAGTRRLGLECPRPFRETGGHKTIKALGALAVVLAVLLADVLAAVLVDFLAVVLVVVLVAVLALAV